MRDKQNIINDLKNENEYFADENSQLKSIVNELRAEKNKDYLDKTNIIKSQKEEIESLKLKFDNLNKEQRAQNTAADKIKIELDESRSQIEKINLNTTILE